MISGNDIKGAIPNGSVHNPPPNVSILRNAAAGEKIRRNHAEVVLGGSLVIDNLCFLLCCSCVFSKFFYN